MKVLSKPNLLPALLLVCSLSGCAVIDTGASVVRAGASVVSTTVGVAGTVAGVAVSTAGIAVTAASAAKTVALTSANVAIATTGTAIAAGTFVVVAATSAASARRADDVATISVVAIAADRFSGPDGRVWITQNCRDVATGQPALWVARRSGENEIRVNEATTCQVVAAQ